MTTTTGQQLAAALRKGQAINSRSRDRRDGHSIKARMLEDIRLACQHDGYFSTEKTALYRAASATVRSYDKHVGGYRIDGMLRFRITSMSPWEFAAFLGDMVDAGITNVGEGELYFARMAREGRARPAGVPGGNSSSRSRPSMTRT
jgi:hypothetical protein